MNNLPPKRKLVQLHLFVLEFAVFSNGRELMRSLPFISGSCNERLFGYLIQQITALSACNQLLMHFAGVRLVTRQLRELR